MNLRHVITASVCGGCMMAGTVASAQVKQAQQVQPQLQQVQPQQAQLQGQTGQKAQWQNSDQTLATCVAIGNQEEIAIARFAESKAKNDDVKEFAKTLVKDHQAFLQKLQRYAPEATRDGYLTEQEQATNNEEQKTSATPSRVQARVQPAGGEVNVAVGAIQQTSATQSTQPIDFIALHRELAENCLRESKQELGKKEGTKFDECFIGYQIAKHAEMKNKLTVFERHASADLRQILDEGLQTTEKHMKKAEQIMKDLAKSDSSKSDRSDSSKK